MKDVGGLGRVGRSSGARGGRTARPWFALVVGTVVLGLVVALTMSLGPNVARGDGSTDAGGSTVGDEGGSSAQPAPGAPTSEQTAQAVEASQAEQPEPSPETDPRAAEEMPHRNLDGEEALELAEGVFGVALAEPVGIYDELEPERFISDNAAIIPGASLPASPEETGGSVNGIAADQPVLVESTLPLRTEDGEGGKEAVDLTLQSPEGSSGELQPQNPLTELAIPAHLGEGITVGGVQIEVSGGAQEVSPTNVEERYAFYPNVAEDEDLVVTPTPTGVETMSDIRSAGAPTTTTYRLSSSGEAELKAVSGGGAELIEGGQTKLVVAPPTATDAEGDAVPVELELDGGDLKVVASPGPNAAFPILVDPNFLIPQWDWQGHNGNLVGWSSYTTNAQAMQPAPYALWSSPQLMPGPDLSSGFGGNAAAGTWSSWEYWVPRYREDIANFGGAPTTWLYQFRAENLWYKLYGNGAAYPALMTGLVDPATGWVAPFTRTGGEGELAGAGNQFISSNAQSLHSVKGAEMALVTNVAESPAKRRDAYMGGATVFIVDEEAPEIHLLTAPTGWTNTVAPPIPYEFEDKGLGVWSVSAAYEGKPLAGAGLGFGCTGDATYPCPRIATSGAAAPGKVSPGSLVSSPAELPTGLDPVQVTISDPLANLGDVAHQVTQTLLLKVDHTGPEVSLSGPLTEQEKIGTTKAEYPLTIKATDGTEGAPQSGVSKVEVKVDGKKVTMPSESAWAPSCTTQNCSFSGAWTMKASEYSVGTHEVEVVATDAVGNPTSTTLEVEVGQGPPQTSFSSPHPTYENHEIPSISFKATREGKPVEGATFRCSLDGETEVPTKPCSSTLKLPTHLAPEKWHLLLVSAVDKTGKADPTPARWKFQTGEYPPVPAPAVANEKLVFPEVGKKTASYYTLEAEWGANPEGKAGEGVSGVSFEMEFPGETSFQPVPTSCVIDGQGRPVSWPIPARSNPGHNAPVYLKVRGCWVFGNAGYPEKEVLFRAVFDGGEKVAGASSPNATEFVYSRNPTRVSTDAVEEVGPASVDLVTGAFTLSHTDVSIPVPGYAANLEFTRVYKSSQSGKEPGYSPTLGGLWQPSMPLESEFEGEAWSRIEEKEVPFRPRHVSYECWGENEVEGSEGPEVVSYEVSCPSDVATNCPPTSCESWEDEEEQPREAWIELISNEGGSIPYEEGNGLVPPEYAKELKLIKEGGNYVLSYPNGTRTTFAQSGPESPTYIPTTISYQANPGSMRMVYAPEGKTLRLLKEIAPSSIECSDAEAWKIEGCRSLEFRYKDAVVNGQPIKLMESIVYYGAAGGNTNGVLVAAYSYGEVTGPQGTSMALMSESDPRVANSAEVYSYDSAHGEFLTSAAPPGQNAWSFGYEFGSGSAPTKLKTVSRSGVGTTTIAYGVPVKGTGAPYDLSSEAIEAWGQTDMPVDATAVFPPNHVPSSYPPSAYTGATVHYMDPEGHQVNVASPSPPGASGQSIATTETDMKGNVVRELTPQNRLAALQAAEPAPKSRELDTHSVYNANGTAMLESWGPVHSVRTQAGEIVQARQHTTIRYDEGAPTPQPGVPPAYLPTKETVGAVVQGREGELEPTVTETHYNWTLRAPTETITDPGGLNIRAVTVYNAAGQVIETRQPKGAAGGTAGDTRYYYYDSEGCTQIARYAHMPCSIGPAKQEVGSGRPQIPGKWFANYNNMDEPTQVLESSLRNKEFKAENERTTENTYDAAGRLRTTTVVATSGVKIPKIETQYDPTLLLPNKQLFVCEKECTGFNAEPTTATYNALGQVTKYEDADGNKTETTYDAYDRLSTVTDGRGTKTFHYDEGSGLLTSMEVSGVGTFTATYDADGNMIARGLPNGLTARTTYNAADEPIKLTYTKTSSCGESCTWYEESLERSIEGRILTDTSSLVKNRYSYDKDGRLTEAQETPTGGQCTSRAYTFDADSNRLTKVTRTGVGGACANSGGTTQKYEYDEADRLMGGGITYDGWGRITNLPGEFAGGKELVTSYFANDMVASQSQGGVTNSFQLDATGRQRQREQAGGVAGTEIFHYDGPGDSLSWTALGTTWSRNVQGLGGELAAVQESTGTTTFKLTDLHGDVVASASSSVSATKLLGTFRFDEFGEPVAAANVGRFGWLGSRGRRTELASGVIQMGARSYVPALGRFLTPDSIPGGSANPYDYANQDPVNQFDLEGTCTKRQCKRVIQRRVARVRARDAHLVKIREHAKAVARAKWEILHPAAFKLGISIPQFHAPYEEKINKAIAAGQGAITTALSGACSHSTAVERTGVLIAGSGVAIAPTGAATGGTGTAAGTGIFLTGTAIGALGAALGLAHESGLC